MTRLDTHPTARPARILVDGKAFVLCRRRGGYRPLACEVCGRLVLAGSMQYRRPRDEASDRERRSGHGRRRWRSHRGQRDRRIHAACIDHVGHVVDGDALIPCPA